MTPSRGNIMPLPSMGNDYQALLTALATICSTGTEDEGVRMATRIIAAIVQALVGDIVSAQERYSDCPLPEYAVKAARESENGNDPSPTQSLALWQALGLLEASRDFSSSAMSSALFCSTQIANYALYAHQYPFAGGQQGRPADLLQTSGALLPFCGGALSAYALSHFDQGRSSKQDWVSLSTEACRMAFWMGLQSDRVAVRFLHEQYGLLPREEALEVGSWCLAVVGWSSSSVEEYLSASPIQHIETVYISAIVAPKTVSISGPPLVLSALELALSREADQDSRAKIKCARVPVFSPFHSLAYMADAAEEFKRVCGEERIGEAERYARAPPSCLVYSSITAQPLPRKSLSLQDLTDQICCQRANYHGMVEQMTCDLVNSGSAAAFTILNIGPGGRLGHSLSRYIESLGTSVKLVDLEERTITHAKTLMTTAHNSAGQREQLAIVGLAYRLPGEASDVDGLSRLLRLAPGALVEKLPLERFAMDDYVDSARPGDRNTLHQDSIYGLFLRDVDKFDAAFFNISPREAEQMDPQHRFYLMTAYEALQRAGFAPEKTASFMRDAVGTFYAASNDDYRDNASADIGSYLITGNGRAFAPGRLSFVHRLQGQSGAIDSGESSFFSALEVASDKLLSGQLETAVVGTSCLFSSPTQWIAMDKAGLLGRHGPGKGQMPFDGDAAGWTRAEASVSLVLKRLSQAEVEGDDIIATIAAVGSSFAPALVARQDYGSIHPAQGPEYTARTAQVEARARVMRKVLQDADCTPAQVDYLECNASGLAVDEDIELEAVFKVFGSKVGARKAPLPIGSVKSVLGCAEAASGAVSLLKVLEMMRTSTLFPQAAPDRPSAWFEGADQGVELCRGTEGVPVDLVCINSYSVGGGNSSLLVKRYNRSGKMAPVDDPRQSWVVGLFGKSVQSIHDQAASWRSHLERDAGWDERCLLQSVSHVSLTRRDNSLPVRSMAVVTSSKELLAFLSSPPAPTMAAKTKHPRLAFFFSGQGSQYEGMARKLARSSRRFRGVLEECDRLCAHDFGLQSFLPSLMGDGTAPGLDAATTQCAIFAIEYGLAVLLRAYKLQPAIVAGHSLGEYAALATAGVLSLRDALYLVTVRAQAMKETIQPGQSGMLAVAADAAKCVQLMGDAHAGDACEVACQNSPTSTVLSGTTEELQRLAVLIKAGGIKCVLLGVPYGFHSVAMEPILETIRHAAEQVTFHPPIVPVLSNVYGQVIDKAGVFGPAYIAQHTRSTVLFRQSIASLCSDARFADVTIGIELGPNAIVLPMVQEGARPPVLSTLLPTLTKARDNLETLQHSLCQLHKAGLSVDWFELDLDLFPVERIRRCDLPTYPFQLKSFWLPYRDRGLITPDKEVLVQGMDAQEGGNDELTPIAPSLGYSLLHAVSAETKACVATCHFQVNKSALFDALCRGHRVSSIGLAPLALTAELYYEAAHLTLTQTYTKSVADPMHVELSNLHVNGPLVWGENKGSNDDVELFLRCIADYSSEEPSISCMLQSRVQSPGAKATTILHSTCLAVLASCTDTREQTWLPMQSLVREEVQSLRDATVAEDGQVDVLDRGTTYDLFAKVVEYSPIYHAAQSNHLRRNSGLSVVSLDGQDWQGPRQPLLGGRFCFHPLTLDAVGQITGLIANLHWLPNDSRHVFIIEACAHISLSARLNELAEQQKSVCVLATVRPLSQDGEEELVADAFILEETPQGPEIIGTILGQRYKAFRSQALASVLKRTLLTRGRPV